MTRKFILTILGLLLLPLAAYAQTDCRAEITYTWKHAGEEIDRSQYWALVERSAPDELQAKAKIQEAVAKEKARASEACHQRHESVADCIGGKFANLSSVLPTLDFASRSRVQAAIHSDCAGQQGVCKEAKGSEPQCTTVAPKEDEKKAEAEGKKGKKGNKK